MSQKNLDTVIASMSANSLDSLESDGDAVDDIEFDPKRYNSSSSAASSIYHTDEEEEKNQPSNGNIIQVKIGDDLIDVKIIRAHDGKVTSWSDISFGKTQTDSTLVSFHKESDQWVQLSEDREIELVTEQFKINTQSKKDKLGPIFWKRVMELRNDPTLSSAGHLKIVSIFTSCDLNDSEKKEKVVLVASDRVIKRMKAEANAKKADKKKKSAEIVEDSPVAALNPTPKQDATEASKVSTASTKVKVSPSTPKVKKSTSAPSKKRKRDESSQENKVDETRQISLTPLICQPRTENVNTTEEEPICSKKIVLSFEYANPESAKADLDKLKQLL